MAIIMVASLQQVQGSPTQISKPLAEMWETRLRDKVRNTAFQPGVCRSYPGTLDASAVAEELWDVFLPLDVCKTAFTKWMARFNSESNSKDLASLRS